jgi:3-O-alpha-D-mannopyranosyl-alpha-D-mannopyranose xylosylphosphotransferase
VFILVNLDNIPLAWSNFIAPEGWFGGKACEQVVINLNTTAATFATLKLLLSRPDQKGVPLDDTKVLLPATSLPPARPLIQPLKHRLPYHVINQYLTDGTLPEEVPPAGPIDIVYTWVNSTSVEFSGVVRDRWEGEDLGRLNGERRWRDNGELRGAVHSAAQAFKDQLRTIHIISGDYPIDMIGSAEDEEGQWTMGQIPRWLDWEKEGESDGEGPNLKWHFHREVFRLPREANELRGWTADDQIARSIESTEDKEDLEESWQGLALPNFNSFAIESRLGYVNDCHENL